MKSLLRRWLLVALAVGWFLAPAALAEVPAATATPTEQRRDEIRQVILRAMERRLVPGASIAVIEGYEIDWAEGFGRRIADQPEPVTTKTLFQAASISKPVTALAVMRLVAAGKLDLDENIERRLTSWHLPESPLAQDNPVTLRRLLSHSAGMSVHGFEGYAIDARRPSLPEILDGKAPANSLPIRLKMKPGYACVYSGGGYCIVQQILCDATGAPFPRLMQDLVLQPVGMTSSTYEQPLPEGLREQAAFGHAKDRVTIPGGYHVYPEMAPAGLWTTPGELALLLVDVQKCAATGQGKLLPQSVAKEMLTVQKSPFGLGFALKDQGPKLAFHHGGSNAGYRCDMIGYPATGQGCVIMTNSDTGSELLLEVMAAVAKAYHWP